VNYRASWLTLILLISTSSIQSPSLPRWWRWQLALLHWGTDFAGEN